LDYAKASQRSHTPLVCSLLVGEIVERIKLEKARKTTVKKKYKK
jgi:hypothetical protein